MQGPALMKKDAHPTYDDMRRLAANVKLLHREILSASWKLALAAGRDRIPEEDVMEAIGSSLPDSKRHTKKTEDLESMMGNLNPSETVTPDSLECAMTELNLNELRSGATGTVSELGNALAPPNNPFSAMASTGAKGKRPVKKEALAVDDAEPPSKIVVHEETKLVNVKVDGDEADRVANMRKAKMEYMKSRAAQPATTRIIKTKSKDAASVTVTGIVTRVNPGSVRGRAGQMAAKLDISLLTTGVILNNAPDAVPAEPFAKGMNIGFLLPTRRVEDAPEEGAAQVNGQNNPTHRLELALGPQHVAHNLSYLPQISVYKQDPKGGERKELDLVTPGMIVQVTGVHANKGSEGDRVFLNASGVTPLLDDPIPSTGLFQALKEQFSVPRVAAASAFRLTSAVGGFFREDVTREPAQQDQIEIFQNGWRQVLRSASAACANAAEITTNISTKTEFEKHGARFKAAVADPYKYAEGEHLFPPLRDQTKSALYAGIVVKPLVEDVDHDEDGNEIISRDHPDFFLLFENPSVRSQLPEMFACCSVEEPPEKGGQFLLRVKIAIQFVADREMAHKTLCSGGNPMLVPPRARSVVGMNVSLRDAAKMTGLLPALKVEDFAIELYQNAEWVAALPVLGRSPNEDGVKTDDFVWAEAHSVNIIGALPFMAVAVSESWIQTNLAGGMPQYVYEKDPTQDLMKDKDGTDLTVNVQLVKDGFQEITSSSFKMANAKMPPNTSERKYYVWWKNFGATNPKAAIESQKCADGEAAVEAVAKNASLSVYEFLLQRAAVFVVAV